MARNQEKAQSMLYRFREAQNAELGIGNRKDVRRPRLASSVKTIRECEKWRGEIMREISRKVSKIQDFGLTDYEVRDINDEINKLIREKGHWENQIVALGGANYKRGVPTMEGEDGGSEVPGGRGYKYFGRAKDLPGVKELFNRTAAQESELESYKSEKYRRFSNQPSSYYGDLDEDDPSLLASEDSLEEKLWKEGVERISQLLLGDSHSQPDLPPIDLEKVKKELGLKEDEIPRPKAESMKSLRKALGAPKGPKGKGEGKEVVVVEGAPKGPKGKVVVVEGAPTGPKGSGKRKAEENGQDGNDEKRLKGKDGEVVPGESKDQDQDHEEEEAADTQMKDVETEDEENATATGTANQESIEEEGEGKERKLVGGSDSISTLFSVLDPEELNPQPKVMDRNDQERFLLEARKRALKREYIG